MALGGARSGTAHRGGLPRGGPSLPLLALPVVACLLLPGLWLASARLSGPSDGTLQYFASATSSGCRVEVVRVVGPGELRPGDAVVAIDGVPVCILAYFSPHQVEARGPAFPELTERERQVLDLLARGQNNVTIAQRLFLSPKTVRNHVSNIFSKLHVTDRTEAAIKARDAGLGGGVNPSA